MGIDILSNWQNPYSGALTCGVRDIIVGKTKWKPPELPLHSKIVNQKQYCIPNEEVRLLRLEGYKTGDSHHITIQLI